MRRMDQLLERIRALGMQPEDFRESFARSGGPGGQNVNKVNTAATVRHLPTGLAATASDSRSQIVNRKLAFERLLTAIETQRAEERQAQLAKASKQRRQRARRSPASKATLLEEKRHRAETKRLRRKVAP
jgi:protein subunit release factor B